MKRWMIHSVREFELQFIFKACDGISQHLYWQKLSSADKVSCRKQSQVSN